MAQRLIGELELFHHHQRAKIRGQSQYIVVNSLDRFLVEYPAHNLVQTHAPIPGPDLKAPESTQLARGTLNRYLLILKRLIFESSVRAGSPSFVAAPDGPEIRP